MSIKPLIPPVEALITKELARASERFGERHHSPHEAYAVMLEEFEETQEALQNVEYRLNAYWARAKINHPPEVLNGWAKWAKEEAIKTACEAIQLAAMCEKALRGYETEDRL